jgi:hypothetical protein
MRDILVPMIDARSRPEHLRFAARLAKAFDAGLTGLYALEPFLGGPEMNSPAMVSEAVAFLLQQRKAAVDGAAPFCTWAREHGVKHPQWSVIQGMFAASVAQAAPWHDLVVLQSNDVSDAGRVSVLGEVLLTCGLPCIIVPDTVREPIVPTRIAVAWNGSVESVRALRAAFPLLDSATKITLLCGDRTASTVAKSWSPTFDIVEYLERHGYAVERRGTRIDDDHAGDSLLDAATDAGAELLVMGAYGRSRLSEWILGGATRHVLQHSRMPLLMRH